MEYSDRQIVDGILSNDRVIIEHFFFKKCSGMFDFILERVFDNEINKDELISELYLHLSSDNWKKIEQFDFRSKLTTWTTVVAIRFFQKKRTKLIGNTFPEALNSKGPNTKMRSEFKLDTHIDIRNAIKNLKNIRYQEVIIALDLHDVQPEELAKQMNITVDNLYNIHRRALLSLKSVMGRKEDYYD